ncbi:MAG: multidrug ABC transporter ATP-binding protein [Parvibaculum sp.]|jgi:ABC-2 type transport system ATP-binding protein|uniref:ABC transporter ATP-binding protein n=1 Tax=Parvibaculum sp. TaxID=2024848 RepID=UPI000C697657|nr:ABC transporter ATP-binding protein [Parvibaculum sp.]MAU59910.1 multidrug ABC transporter ATP-binding protein [Parvibaculum sp.]|tara:strand:+ start:322 stop:1287 length:966 start_codon:yes stop_codon:yes gene_type:complete
MSQTHHAEPAADAPLIIDVQGLTKSFGETKVVDGIDMQVAEGEIYGFLGPNGSGKTTTIRMLCGLLTPDAGAGTCLGHDIISDSAKIKLKVGYMTQRFSLYEDLSIRENLAFVASIYGLKKPKQAVRETLEKLGLETRANQLAGALSGGWKQRLALAAAIMHEPKLLLLDEPTAGVDPKARRDFWDEIHQLADNGLTVLVSTHYMDEAERCHKICYLAYGKLLARGTVNEVIRQSGLVTWLVSSNSQRQINRLARELADRSGVEMVAPFGATLHVSGANDNALEAAVAPWRGEAGLDWQKVEPTLEDVFIHMMQGASDNFG